MASFIRTGYSLGETSTRYDGPGYGQRSSDATIEADTGHSERSEKLRKTVEADIIPRLMMLHGCPAQKKRKVVSNDNPQSQFDVGEFSEIALDQDLGAIQAYIERLIERGASMDSIFLDLLAPTARYLGDLWLSDARSFAEVTIGLGHLHLLLRTYGSALETAYSENISGCRMVLSPVRGDRHIFGLCVIDLYLRRAGCEVELYPRFEMSSMTRKVNTEWVDVIGLSASCDVLIDELSSDIRSLRRASCNNSVEVIVGGAAFVGHPERVASVGADGFAEDASEAVRLVGGIMKNAVRG